MKLSRMLRWIFLVSLLGGIALTIVARMFFIFTMSNWGGLIGISFLIALFSGVSLACALTIERGRFEKLLWSGIAAAIIGLTGWSFGIFFDALLSNTSKEICINILTPVTSWSALCALVAVLTRNRISNLAARVTCSITILSSALLAVFIAIMVSREVSAVYYDNEVFFKPIMYVSVLAITCLLLTMLLSNIKQIQGTTEELIIKIEMDVSCPRCELKQSIMTGGATCSKCGMRIKVSIP